MSEVKYPEHLLKKYPREFLSRVAKKLSYKRWGEYATALLDFCRKHGVDIDDVPIEQHHAHWWQTKIAKQYYVLQLNQIKGRARYHYAVLDKHLSKMKTFKLRVVTQAVGHPTVEAPSLEVAKEIVIESNASMQLDVISIEEVPYDVNQEEPGTQTLLPMS